jgi:hypothetical protein
MTVPGPSTRRAFAAAELAALLVIAAVVACVLLVAGDRARRAARLGEDTANLRQIGSATHAFGADKADLFWTFSWKKGESKSAYPDLNNAVSDLQAAANQAVDILRRVAGREDMPKIFNWVPHLGYSQLVLQDYLFEQGGLPSRTFISAADKNRLLWAGDPKGFDQNKFGPKQPFAGPENKRWPYSSSYQLATSFYDKGAVGQRISQGGMAHNLFLIPPVATLGGKAIADTAFPSHKVLLHDSFAWHFTRFGPKAAAPYCTLPEARLPMLFVDGGVRVMAAPASNKGWQPNTPGSANPSSIIYQPQTWEEPTPSGQPSQGTIGAYRWTRNYLAGRDFGGPEIGPP